MLSLTTKHWERFILFASCVLAIFSTFFSFQHGWILAYGDAESHINIAKRVVDSLTPGFAQLGGIWLPLSHVFMLPFVYFDPMWQSGLAGSITSGICYIISCLYSFKLTYAVTKQLFASFLAFVVFALNPNVLYMQSTPMTELPFLAFFILSTYYFYRFIRDDTDIIALTLSALFAFCGAMTRYDGWFIVIAESILTGLIYIKNRNKWHEMEAKVLLFSTIAFLGIILWFVWELLIFNDPLYFSHSIYSAHAQQQGFLKRNQLPAYHNLSLSLAYYSLTAAENIGYLGSVIAMVGCVVYIIRERTKTSFILSTILFIPFLFNTYSLYAGQSIILIPQLTPAWYEWHLFNVRYGLLMIPFAAVFTGYLFSFRKLSFNIILLFLVFFQFLLYPLGFARNITLNDGLIGLSASKDSEAGRWIKTHYDGGLVLMDDFSKPLSNIRSNLPLRDTIYVGNKPYWDVSLQTPQIYARWIVMSKNDVVWKIFIANPAKLQYLYKYFNKAYTSPDVLIFKRQS